MFSSCPPWIHGHRIPSVCTCVCVCVSLSLSQPLRFCFSPLLSFSAVRTYACRVSRIHAHWQSSFCGHPALAIRDGIVYKHTNIHSFFFRAFSGQPGRRFELGGVVLCSALLKEEEERKKGPISKPLPVPRPQTHSIAR